MKPLALVLCCAALSGACTTLPTRPLARGAATAPRAYDFNWRLSGDPAVAPLQVFHDGRDTWLHFAPGQAVPAVFVDAGQGEQIAAYTRQAPYVVVAGMWPRLVLRGGRSRAQADYLGAAAGQQGGAAIALPPQGTPVPAEPAAASDHVDGIDTGAAGRNGRDQVLAAKPVAAATVSAAMSASPARSAARVSTSTASPAPALALTPTLAPAATLALAPTPALASAPTPVPVPAVFHATPADGTMRALLRNWSRQAGWTFDSEHWAVDVDIPLSGSASFSDGYQNAVRDLLAASELGERPVQPCFYANRVLRVVPLNQPCDRSAPLAKVPA